MTADHDPDTVDHDEHDSGDDADESESPELAPPGFAPPAAGDEPDA